MEWMDGQAENIKPPAKAIAGLKGSIKQILTYLVILLSITCHCVYDKTNQLAKCARK